MATELKLAIEIAFKLLEDAGFIPEYEFNQYPIEGGVDYCEWVTGGVIRGKRRATDEILLIKAKRRVVDE